MSESMSVTEYKERVIALFKSGKATPEQWEEMAAALLIKSEHDGLGLIDTEIGVA